MLFRCFHQSNCFQFPGDTGIMKSSQNDEDPKCSENNSQVPSEIRKPVTVIRLLDKQPAVNSGHAKNDKQKSSDALEV